MSLKQIIQLKYRYLPMRKLLSVLVLIFLCGFLLLNTGCRKNNLTTNGHLEFSLDTLVFDTVFTTVGSTTEQFKIYNRNTKTIIIDEVELMGGSNSPFRINVDGISASSHQNIQLEGNDSLFVFVEVTLDVNNQNSPLIIEDSVRFKTNGLDQYVKLAVWGQDAYFYYNDTVQGTWTSEKPHVIYGYALVDSSETLNIEAGTNVHLHKNAILYVNKGSLNVNGFLDNEVIFQGDRLESIYDNVPGQYYGIYFNQAKTSNIDYAIIKNGTSGIHVFSSGVGPLSYAVTIRNTQIYNHARYGIFLYEGASIQGENLLVSRNGFHSLLVLKDSKFNFNHCNFLGYGSAQSPAVGIRNYLNDPTETGSISEGVVYNSIISGNLETEIVLDTIIDFPGQLNLDFQNCFIQSEEEYQDGFYQNVIWRIGFDNNTDPQFNSITDMDYGFASNSLLHGNGFATSVLTDILGNFRNNPPDIGAIEQN